MGRRPFFFRAIYISLHPRIYIPRSSHSYPPNPSRCYSSKLHSEKLGFTHPPLSLSNHGACSQQHLKIWIHSFRYGRTASCVFISVCMYVFMLYLFVLVVSGGRGNGRGGGAAEEEDVQEVQLQGSRFGRSARHVHRWARQALHCPCSQKVLK